MKKFLILLTLFTLTACGTTTVTPNNMKLTSSAFENGDQIPVKYTCDGDDINPPLTIEEVPEEAKKLALIVDDPDAPAGTWIHWVVWNIDASTKEIPENASPSIGNYGTTSFGTTGYGGPCPPSGTHRYFFKLYALKAGVTLPPGTDAKGLEKAIKDYTLDEAQLMGTYSR